MTLFDVAGKCGKIAQVIRHNLKVATDIFFFALTYNNKPVLIV